MKSLMVLMLLSGASLSGVLAEEVRSAGGEEVLETPGGHPIAVLLPGAVRRTLEEKDGYVRIVVEGWVRAGAPSVQGAIPPPTFPPPIQPPAAPGPSPVAPEVSGRITLRLASGEVRYGAGARIMLLGKAAQLEAKRVALVSSYQQESRALREEIVALEIEKRQALNSSDNFTRAGQNLDAAKRRLATKQGEFQALEAKYDAREQALLEEFKVVEVSADPGGAYRVGGIVPGEYRVWATFSEGPSVYRWYRPLTVEGERGLTLDLAAGKAGDDPFLVGP